ncbi:MAG: radical SAM family heme chaperone HemW [Anaerolineaceae bacterium]
MTGLYIHIPFCLRRCEYCDFITEAGMTKIVPAYLNALVKEVRFVGERSGKRGGPIESVYIGGGTPSLLRADQVKVVLGEVKQQFEVVKGAEVTLEANPGTTRSLDFGGLLEAGVNRLSFGAQSFLDDELKALGRIHSVEQIIASCEQARLAGFDNISLDLIFGIPGQTLETWKNNLQAVFALNPEHLSLYSLILEEGTLLFEHVSQGKMHLPEGDVVADMYLMARVMLGEAGFEHYEISNWAREERLESQHNKVYWHNQPYHAFGTGAHRCFDGCRSFNVENTIEYIGRMMSEPLLWENWLSPATAEVLEVTPKISMQETMMLGLRLVREGISERAFLDRYGQEMTSVFAKEIKRILARGLVEWVDGSDGRVLRLTQQGVMVGNQAFMEFV